MADTITVQQLRDQVGGETRTTKWFTIDQARIDTFADVTEDWQFIHVDPEAAAKTPFGGTIAHGFLSLSMLSAMSVDCEPIVKGTAMGVNYGFDKVRFTSPVKVGARVRGRFTTIKVDEKSPTHILTTTQVEVEIEGEKRPALTAQWLGLTVLKEGANG